MYPDFVPLDGDVSGVISATAEEEKIVVVGDGVDSVVLTQKLRKKMGYVELISVTEEKKSESKPPEKPADKAEKVTNPTVWAYPPPYAYQYEIPAEQPPCCRIV